MDSRQQTVNSMLGNLAKANQGEIDPQDNILDFKFSIREATMILNKMNTANFTGFGEASQAMQIFAKIQATVKDSQLAEESKSLKPIRSNTTFAKPNTPPTPNSEHSVPPTATEGSESVEESSTPVAPMAAVNEIKPQPVSEEATTPPVDTGPPEDAGIFSVIDKTGDV